MQSPRVYLAAGLLVVLLSVGGVAYVATGSGHEVGIQQAYFVAAGPDGAQLNLTARLFVTNHGLARSDPLSVTVFVVPTHSGLASSTMRVEVGSLAGRTTEEVTIPLAIPRFDASRSYRVDFLVFEDGLLTQKGQGGIGWGAPYAYDAGKGYAAQADGLSVSAPSFERVG